MEPSSTRPAAPSTLAAAIEGLDSVGIDPDLDDTYLPVAEARAVHAGAQVDRNALAPTG